MKGCLPHYFNVSLLRREMRGRGGGDRRRGQLMGGPLIWVSAVYVAFSTIEPFKARKAATSPGLFKEAPVNETVRDIKWAEGTDK